MAYCPPVYVPKHQAAAQLDQAAPVQNTWYTVLDTTRNVKLYTLHKRVETANETLEMRVTIDGIVLTSTQAATFATSYYTHLSATSSTALVTTATGVLAALYAPLTARSIKVELRKTTATGAGNLKGTVIYAKW